MSNYTIQSKALNPGRVFILQKSELEKRLDPFYYVPAFCVINFHSLIAEHITGIRQQAQQLKDKTNEALKKASDEIEKILLG